MRARPIGLATSRGPEFDRERASLAATRLPLQPALVSCAVAAILVPAHPSLQSPLAAQGLSAALVCAIFAVPVLLGALKARLFTRRVVALLLLFVGYLSWLLARAVFSPAFGQINHMASVRSLFVLTPLALLMALVASVEQRSAAKAIFALGLVAVAHYCLLVFVLGSLDDPSGFRSLASDPEKRNYQSTSFYFGFVGLGSALLFFFKQRIALVAGLAATLGILGLMATIGARSSLVALLATMAVMALLLGLLRRFAVFVVLVVGVIVVASGLGAIGTMDRLPLIDQLVVIDRFLTLTEGDDASHRVRLFGAAIEMWWDSPGNFLFGGGVGAFPLYIRETDVGWYPHNFFLESVAEGGLPAGSCLLAIAIHFVVKVRAAGLPQATPEHVYLLSVAIYAAVAYQFIGGLQTIWIPFFFLALYLFSQPGRRG